MGDALQVHQAKNRKFQAIQLIDASTGVRTALGQLIDTIRARPVRGLKLLLNMQGKPLTRPMLRTRFGLAARQAAEAAGNAKLAERIKAFQFRDIRAKAASDIDSLEDASRLLGHTKEQITDVAYRRVGERVKPTK